jgi:hypothetical protein
MTYRKVNPAFDDEFDLKAAECLEAYRADAQCIALEYYPHGNG